MAKTVKIFTTTGELSREWGINIPVIRGIVENPKCPVRVQRLGMGNHYLILIEDVYLIKRELIKKGRLNEDGSPKVKVTKEPE